LKSSDVSSLKEQCARFIAQEIVKNDCKYYYHKLPSSTIELVTQKIEQIRYIIEYEIMTEKINKESQKQKIAFLWMINLG
jgi:hypothetical protein